jgi:hypothetical protein
LGGSLGELVLEMIEREGDGCWGREVTGGRENDKSKGKRQKWGGGGQTCQPGKLSWLVVR